MSFFSHLSVKSIVGYLVSFFVLLCQSCGVDVHDLAPQLSLALANLTQAVAALVPLGVAIWGHIQLAQKHAALVQASTLVGTTLPAGNAARQVLPVLVAFLICGGTVLDLTGCATTGGTSPVLTQAESYAWSVANALQTVNTSTGQPLDETLATKALGVAGLTGPKTSAYTAIAATLVNAAIHAGEVAHAAGASGSTIQANQSAVLSDPAVIETAASAAPAATVPASN